MKPELQSSELDLAHNSEEVTAADYAGQDVALPKNAPIWKLGAAGAAIALTRIFIGVLTLKVQAGTITPGPFGGPPKGISPTAFSHWDSGWIEIIVHHGYVNRQSSAFYPAYPLTVRFVHFLVGVHVATTSIAVALSWVFFTAACALLGLLLAKQLGATPALLGISLLALSPASIFFFSEYAESLLLLLTVASASLAIRRQWIPAAILAGLASSTGPIGALYGVSLAAGYLVENRKWMRTLLILVLGQIGSIGYAAFLWIRFGNPLENFVVQKDWIRHTVFPFSALFRNAYLVLADKVHFAPLPLPSSNLNMAAVWIIDDAMGFACLVALIAFGVLAYRSKSLFGVPPAWLIFAVLVLLLTNSSAISTDGNFPSTEALARLLGSSFAFYAIAAFLLARYRVLAGPAVIVSSFLAFSAQILFMMGFWMT